MGLLLFYVAAQVFVVIAAVVVGHIGVVGKKLMQHGGGQGHHRKNGEQEGREGFSPFLHKAKIVHIFYIGDLGVLPAFRNRGSYEMFKVKEKPRPEISGRGFLFR